MFPWDDANEMRVGGFWDGQEWGMFGTAVIKGRSRVLFHFNGNVLSNQFIKKMNKE